MPLILATKQHVKSEITAHLDKRHWAHPASHSCCDISPIDRVISRPSVGSKLGGLAQSLPLAKDTQEQPHFQKGLDLGLVTC